MSWTGKASVKTARICLILLLGFVVRPPTGRAADEWATWQLLSLKYLDTRNFDLVFYGELRSSFKPSRFGGYLLSQQVKLDLLPNLGAGVNYTFLSLPSENSDELTDTHRAEFELVPRFKAGNWLEVSARQRLELRWLEGRRGPSERTRHRLQLDFPVHCAGRLRSVFLYDEVFYDYTQHRVTENRITPIGLDFRLTKKMNFSVFYTLQELRAGDGWYNRHVLNTMLSVAL
jgi:hypothetical protein